MRRRGLSCTAALLLVASAACGSGETAMTCKPWGTPEEISTRPSPFDSIMISSSEGVRAKLCYSRPSTRGREIFGGLVPYDTLWRTGANEPTILHLAEPADIAGVSVDAGEYSLYTVPNESQWMLVVNASTSQWGLTREERGVQGNLFPNAYTDEVRAQEIARVPIGTEEIPFVEQLTARFDGDGQPDARLLVDWATTRIVVPLRLGAAGG